MESLSMRHRRDRLGGKRLVTLLWTSVLSG
jgi:hypothetical protein